MWGPVAICPPHPRARATTVGAVVQSVEYRTPNREVAGSTHTRSTASNLEQVANRGAENAGPC